MSTEAFNKKTEEPQTEEVTTELVEQPNTGMVTADDLEGEVDMSDIRIPRINVVNALSHDLVKLFPVGTLVLDKQIKLAEPGQGIACVVIELHKSWQEKIDYDSNDIPAVFKTVQEVLDYGGHFEYNGKKTKPKYFEKRADMDLLVEITDSATASKEKEEYKGMSDAELHDAALTYALMEVGDLKMAPARLTVTSTAYTDSAVEVITARKLKLGGSARNGRFVLIPNERTNGKNTWFTPAIKCLGRLAPDRQAEVDAAIDALKG